MRYTPSHQTFPNHVPPNATHLDRYRAGEREIVWRELMALGSRVREPGYLPDARAVAREIMQRARHNLETIIARLESRAYAFADALPPLRPPTPQLSARLDRLEERYGLLPLALRTFYDVVGEVSLAGSLPGLSGVATFPELSRLVADARAALGAASPAVDGVARSSDGTQGVPAPADAKAKAIEEARATVGDLMRRFTQPGPERHAVARTLLQQMAARKAGAGVPVIVSDPLVILAPPTDEIFDPSIDDDDPDPDAIGQLQIDIAPDALHKANLSGGGPYSIAFPNLAVDGPVHGTTWPSLVDYLRHTFSRGGFPGLPRVDPNNRVDWLTTDLLEI